MTPQQQIKYHSMTDANDKVHPEIITDLEGNGLQNTYSYGGLTKREYFAAMAMQGLLGNPHERVALDEPTTVSIWSVAYADALIAELNRA